MHKIQDRLWSAHLCSCEFYALELYSALTRDAETRVDKEKKFSIYNTREIYSNTIDNKVNEIISHSLNSFRKTFKWDIGNQEIQFLKDHQYHHLINKLVDKEIISNQQINSEKLATSDYMGNIVCFGPDRAISFGHYTAIFQILRGIALNNEIKNTKIIFFDATTEISVFNEFSLLLSNIKGVEVVNLGEDRLTAGKLLQYWHSGGTEVCRSKYLKLSYQNYGVESDVAFRQKAEEETVDMDLSKKMFFYYGGKLTNLMVDHLTTPSDIRINKLFDRHKSLVCVANRDECFTGNSQPWRDSKIEKFEDSINYLLERKYQVCRINSVGKEARIKDDNFVDCVALEKISPCDQLNIINQCDYFIGLSTGITEYASQVFYKNTLYIDSACIYNSGFDSGKVIHYSKKLIISNRDILEKADQQKLLSFLFTEEWQPNNAINFGLHLEELTESEIKSGIIRFITNSIDVRNLFDLMSLCDINFKCKNSNIHASTFENLANIIKINALS